MLTNYVRRTRQVSECQAVEYRLCFLGLNRRTTPAEPLDLLSGTSYTMFIVSTTISTTAPRD
jgi:hypothetical protein